MMINCTVVKHWSRTQATRALSTVGAENNVVVTGRSGVSRNAVHGLGRVSVQVRVWTDSNAAKANCVKKRAWEDQTCRIETLTAPGGDQIGKSENEAYPGRATFGLASQQRKRARVEEVSRRVRPSRHHPRTARAVREPKNQKGDGKDQGVQECLREGRSAWTRAWVRPSSMRRWPSQCPTRLRPISIMGSIGSTSWITRTEH